MPDNWTINIKENVRFPGGIDLISTRITFKIANYLPFIIYLKKYILCLIYLANIAVYSNHPRAAAASAYLAIIFGRIASGVSWLLRSTAELMQQPAIACLTLCLSRGMNGVIQRELSFLLLLWGLSDPRIMELRKMPQSFSIKLHRENSSLWSSGHIWGYIP